MGFFFLSIRLSILFPFAFPFCWVYFEVEKSLEISGACIII